MQILPLIVAFFVGNALVCAQTEVTIVEAESAIASAKTQIAENELQQAKQSLLRVLENGISPTEPVWRNAASEFARLSSSFQPAREDYERLRSNARDTWEVSRTPESLAVYFYLNHYARFEKENLKLFDSLDAESKEIYKKRMFRIFWKSGRYNDFLDSIDPFERLAGQISIYERIKAMHQQDDRIDRLLSMTRDSIFDVSSRSLEAMLKTGRKEQASEFIQKVLAFEDSDQTRAMIKSVAEKTDSLEITRTL